MLRMLWLPSTTTINGQKNLFSSNFFIVVSASKLIRQKKFVCPFIVLRTVSFILYKQINCLQVLLSVYFIN